MFSGSIPALVTPFRAEESGTPAFDEAAYRRLIDWQIEAGSAALVPCGTTGEVATLTHEEQHRIIAVCIAQARGRVPVIAGCGSNDTAVAQRHMREAQAAGAAAALVVAPYYNRPSQAGLIAHFSALAQSCDLPIILYNVPGRTVADLLPATVVELALRFPGRIVGIKDASGNIARVADHRIGAGPGFVQLCGDDALWLAHNAAGGAGCISVTANVAPKLCADFQTALAAGDLARARALNDRLQPLHHAMFADASPGPAKYALGRLHDWFPGALRLPLVAAGQAARDAVDVALAHAGLV